MKMGPLSKYSASTVFVGGLLAGLVIYQAALWLGGWSLVNTDEYTSQRGRLADLEDENRVLSEDLFKPRVIGNLPFAGDTLPYDADANARLEFNEARKSAVASGKFLMVTFGANWCLDCRTLHHNLNSDDLTPYTNDRFLFVNVDVGKFNQNADLARDLGVSLSRGIPVAIFFDPEGEVIGTTNEGELEPARRYSSKQILKFLRDIAERSQVIAPDQIHANRDAR